MHGLLVLLPPNFKSDIRNVKGRHGVWSFFTRLRGRKMARIATSIIATIADHFFRMPPLNKPFTTISDQANRLLEHL